MDGLVRAMSDGASSAAAAVTAAAAAAAAAVACCRAAASLAAQLLAVCANVVSISAVQTLGWRRTSESALRYHRMGCAHASSCAGAGACACGLGWGCDCADTGSSDCGGSAAVFCAGWLPEPSNKSSPL